MQRRVSGIHTSVPSRASFLHPHPHPTHLGHHRTLKGTLWAIYQVPTGYFTHGSNLACTHALEKGMATHSSILAWRIPGTEEPGGLPSVGSHRVGHDWSDLAAAAEQCIYVNPNLPIHRTLPSPHRIHLSVLYVCVYSCPANRLICTIFLGSIYICQYIESEISQQEENFTLNWDVE